MIRNKKYNRAFILALIVVTFSSCNKDGISGIDWHPTIALPLAKSSFSIKDILSNANNNKNIKVGTDGSINLVFSTKLLSKRAEDLFPITNQSFDIGLNFNPNEIAAYNILPKNTTLPTITYNKQLAFYLTQGIILDTITIKQANLLIDISSLPCKYALTLSMPDVRKNNFPLSISFIKNAGDTAINIDLSNYNIILGTNGGTNNSIKINNSLTLTKGNSNLTNSDSLAIKVAIENLKFKRLYGQFKSFELTPDADTVAISLFESASGLGTINIDNPKLVTTIKNSFGISIDATITKFDSYNDKSNPTIMAITGSGVPSPLPVQSPIKLGDSTITTFTLDKSNSNIVQVINNKPKNIIYIIDAKTKPSAKGFVLDNSLFDVEMELDIPLSGSISDFVFRDTIPFKFDQGSALESVSFRTNINNGFPFETNLQVLFADSLNNVLDSLVKGKKDELIIASAIVDGIGKVTSQTPKMSDLTVASTVVPKLKNVRKFFIEVRNSSYKKSSIKLYDTYKMDILLGVKAKLNL